MLGNAQTLLGVLVTLMVLCLFNDKTNFLLTLFMHISSDLSEQIREKTLKIKTTVSGDLSPDTFYSVKYWKSHVPPETMAKIDKLYDDLSFQNIRFLTETSKLNDLPIRMQKYMDRKELGYIELHLFLLAVFVMVCDLCLPPHPIVNYFLLNMTLLSCLYTSNLWLCYWNDRSFKAESFSAFDLDMKKRLKRIVPVAFFYVVVGLLSLGLYGIPMNTALVALLQMGVVSFFVLLHFRKGWKGMEQVRYNNRFVVKHTLMIVGYSVVMALSLYAFKHGTWLHDWAESQNMDALISFMDVWRSHFGETYSPCFAGKLFTLYVACCSIFAPVWMEYLLTRKHAKLVLEGLQDKVKFYDKTVKQLSSEYKQLIEEHIKASVKK